MSESIEHPSPPARRRFQFTLRGLLIGMAVFSVMAAIAGGLLRNQRADGFTLSHTTFVLVSLIAPIAIVILLSLLSALGGLIRRWNDSNRR